MTKDFLYYSRYLFYLEKYANNYNNLITDVISYTLCDGTFKCPNTQIQEYTTKV